ncbi:Uncharacterised protein [Acinetobacter baumannii]|nr:Uncharacterised protein [Acinetobacter baumannii]
MASPVTRRASRQARNLISGVRIRTHFCASTSPPSARGSSVAICMNIERACSVGSIIFSNCFCISGMSIRCLPKARRWRATNSASLSARRISPAARTPLDRRDMLTMSAICWKPRPISPIR